MLGQELGLRNIVDSMIEQVKVDNYMVFPQLNPVDGNISENQFLTKYAMFLCALLDNRYDWFIKELYDQN